jgi:hypothetical protein
MDLETIIGKACLDEKFREALFKDFDDTAVRYEFVLTPEVQAPLKGIIQGPCAAILKKLFETMRVVCCPIPKCPWGG